LIKTALRFDGYRYLKETGFDTNLAIEQLHEDLPTDWDDPAEARRLFHPPAIALQVVARL
jgi:hypothetical protein